MKQIFFLSAATALLAAGGCAAATVTADSDSGEAARQSSGFAGHGSVSRHFRFNYQFDVSGLEAGKQARIWLPVPKSNEFQEVAALEAVLPGEPTFHTEPKYGNRILYVDAAVPANGVLKLNVPYDILRHEVRALDSKVKGLIDKTHRELFLQPNTKVPIDGRPLELLSNLPLSVDTFQAANQLYDLVDSHVTYNKEGTGWGNGDSVWVCDSRRGNCTDFHSLFISLARSQGIPSRFEIGFPIPAEPQGTVGGYHCWAWSHIAQRGWIPVDISEADKHPEMKKYYFGSLTPDRVAFSVGRDIQLTPKSAQESLNFFVYPHVEFDGEVVPREQISLHFSYADMQK